MASVINTFSGLNTVFPVSAYDPTNPQYLGFIANWGDSSEENIKVPRFNNKDREYYYEFNKTYEIANTYTVAICAYRFNSAITGTGKQLANYTVYVDSLTAQEAYPTLKIADISNFVSYKVFYFNVDDDGVNRNWTNRQLSTPVYFGSTIVGYLSTGYSASLPGVISVSLSANQAYNQNWPLKTKLLFNIIEVDNQQSPPVTSILIRGYVYVYEIATNSAIFL